MKEASGEVSYSGNRKRVEAFHQFFVGNLTAKQQYLSGNLTGPCSWTFHAHHQSGTDLGSSAVSILPV